MNKRAVLIFRIISILCILALVSGILLTFLYADADTPSSWAQADVQRALELGLVPQELQGNFTAPVKRNEYTALAVNLYKKTGRTIIISESDTFSDIEGDYYERQLIEAHNAGIIGGYPDKTFRPLNNISREEISKLLVNLITAVFPNEELQIPDNYVFNDKAQVAEWALPYVNYCYGQEIIKGISPMTIGPKEATTREQAIIMILRLAVRRNMLSKENLNINVIDNKTEYENKNMTLVDVLYYISTPGFYNILQSSEDKLVIKSQSDIYYIKMTKQNGKLVMTAQTKEPDNSEFRYLVSNLLKTSSYTEKAAKLFSSNLDKASQTNDFYFGEKIEGQYLINGYTIEEPDRTKTYVFMLEEY